MKKNPNNQFSAAGGGSGSPAAGAATPRKRGRAAKDGAEGTPSKKAKDKKGIAEDDGKYDDDKVKDGDKKTNVSCKADDDKEMKPTPTIKAENEIEDEEYF